jgi:hypothetical protein
MTSKLTSHICQKNVFVIEIGERINITEIVKSLEKRNIASVRFVNGCNIPNNLMMLHELVHQRKMIVQVVRNQMIFYYSYSTSFGYGKFCEKIWYFHEIIEKLRAMSDPFEFQDWCLSVGLKEKL